MQLITSVHQLENYLQSRELSLKKCELSYLNEIQVPYPLRFSEYYAGLIDWANPEDPLRKMVLPHPAELSIRPYELSDPIGDRAHEAVPGLIHRYPDRCLLLLTTHCRIHCRFCFRREVVGKVRPVDFKQIVTYLAMHTEVQEVIFSGGDPLTLPAAFLETVNKHLLPLEHIKTWRFHTRLLAADPNAITPELTQVFSSLRKRGKQVVVVAHVDHALEVTSEFRRCADSLRDSGALLLSQSVLLAGVNATAADLSTLFRALLSAGVQPYYLHHPDFAPGTHHFRVSIEKGKQLYRSLRGKLSGICIPEYVLDLPGGYGKIPVLWLRHDGAGNYSAESFTGKKIQYTDPVFKIASGEYATST